MMPRNVLQRPALRLLLCLLLPLMIQGCAAFANDRPPAVTVKGNSYCDVAEKCRWSTQDTRPTIDACRRENAKIDRLCKPRGQQ